MTRAYREHRYATTDGLTLFAKIYEGEAGRTPLLCLHGLTRNADDFDALLDRLPDWPAISVDQRGRARSDHDPDPANYRPDVYCQDMLSLLDGLGLERAIAIGTSMGGIMTLMLAAQRPGLFEGAIINDIGPVVDPAGMARLRGYVGQIMTLPDWNAAIAEIQAQGPDIYPDFTDQDWRAFAERVCEETADGQVRFRYDPAIANGLTGGDASAVPPNLWPLYTGPDALPMLILRGETSDILSAETAEQMARLRPDARLITVPNRGHAPTLIEPVVLAAIRDFLEPLA